MACFGPRLADEGGMRIYQRVDRPLVPVVAADGAARHQGGPRSGWRGSRRSSRRTIAGLETVIHEKAGQPFTIGSPKQLGEILFDKLGYKGGQERQDGAILHRPVGAGRPRRARGRGRDACTGMASAIEAQVHLHRRPARRNQPRYRASPHQLQPSRCADRAALVKRSQPTEHPHPHRDRPPDP